MSCGALTKPRTTESVAVPPEGQKKEGRERAFNRLSFVVMRVSKVYEECEHSPFSQVDRVASGRLTREKQENIEG